MAFIDVLTKHQAKWKNLLLAIVILVGSAVRLHEISYNLDGDEVFSAELANSRFATVISRSLDDRPHPPLYNLILHAWIAMFGPSERSVRAPSILLSAAFLFTLWVLLRLLVPFWIALGVLLTAALSPLFIYYGQQARPYALIAFLSAANLLAFVRLLAAPTVHTRLIVWVLCCTVLVYSQYLGALVIVLEIGFAFFMLRSERYKIVGYGAVAILMILPWLIVAMGPKIATNTDPLNYISWIGRPTSTDFLWFYASTFGEVPAIKVRWLWVMLGILNAAYMRSIIQSRNLPPSHAFLFCMAITVPVITYAASVWGPKSMFVSRQLLGAAIAFLLSVSICISRLPRRLATVFLLALILWTTAAVPGAFPHNRKPPWFQVVAELDRYQDAIPVVAAEEWIRGPLAYYRKTGSIRLWEELVNFEKEGTFLFICRPFRCSIAEMDGINRKKSLLARWCWGTAGCGEPNQLYLYRLDRTKDLS